MGHAQWCAEVLGEDARDERSDAEAADVRRGGHDLEPLRCGATLAREELGLDPDALGSPWSAAGSSLLAFGLGAFVVVLPYLIGAGTAALLSAVGLAVLVMFAVGGRCWSACWPQASPTRRAD
ncbi:VIT1/CCC1 transporter family protein [Streptacidiphilus sp. EB103A]|uniref:VIT1/CCC1 transporter family protein n=1 Tax=Streptacidiphilus sp. EB103A TaxID=3156275 RepID=UPI0035121B31